MTPADAWRAALAAQHPERHAPELCPCRETRLDRDTGGHECRTHRAIHPIPCDLCDRRLAANATLPPEVVAAIETAVAGEREAAVTQERAECALVAEALGQSSDDKYWHGPRARACYQVATAIRERRKETP